jgi:uncharacterized membrane protein HdeD (DUF308 family)
MMQRRSTTTNGRKQIIATGITAIVVGMDAVHHRGMNSIVVLVLFGAFFVVVMGRHSLLVVDIMSHATNVDEAAFGFWRESVLPPLLT